jgi:hypothetical protein
MWITCTACRHFYDTDVSGGHYCTVSKQFTPYKEHGFVTGAGDALHPTPVTPTEAGDDPLPKVLVNFLASLDRQKSKRSNKITLGTFNAVIESIRPNGSMQKLIQVMTEVAEDLRDITAFLHHTWEQDEEKKLRPVAWPSAKVVGHLERLLRYRDPKATVRADQPKWSDDPVLVVDSTENCPRRFAGYVCVEPTDKGGYRFCSGFLSTLTAGTTTTHDHE